MSSLQQQLTVGFLTELDILKRTPEKDFELNIIPFLEIFEVNEYVDLMLKVHSHSPTYFNLLKII